MQLMSKWISGQGTWGGGLGLIPSSHGEVVACNTACCCSVPQSKGQGSPVNASFHMMCLRIPAMRLVGCAVRIICIYIYTHIRRHKYTYIHKYIYIYICTHTHYFPHIFPSEPKRPASGVLRKSAAGARGPRAKLYSGPDPGRDNVGVPKNQGP